MSMNALSGAVKQVGATAAGVTFGATSRLNGSCSVPHRPKGASPTPAQPGRIVRRWRGFVADRIYRDRMLDSQRCRGDQRTCRRS
jgi:hypothetical protein